MKVRITFTGDIEITVPDNTEMDKYLVDNARELTKLAVDEASIIPDEWEEIDEEPTVSVSSATHTQERADIE